MNSHSIIIDFMEWNLAFHFYYSNGLTCLKGNISSIHQKPIMSVYLVCFLWYERISFDLFCRTLRQCTGIKQKKPFANNSTKNTGIYLSKPQFVASRFFFGLPSISIPISLSSVMCWVNRFFCEATRIFFLSAKLRFRFAYMIATHHFTSRIWLMSRIFFLS